MDNFSFLYMEQKKYARMKLSILGKLDMKEKEMNIFDIIGPVMVGPSSSHTAGAVRIGFVSRKLLGEPVKSVQLLLYGSFLATGKGHGTDRALVAGLLGMQPDDERVPYAFEEAKKSRHDLCIWRGESKRSSSKQCGSEHGGAVRKNPGGNRCFFGRRTDENL